MTALWGLLLGVFSGIMTGSFSLPMKKTTRWSWEATWMIWSICALFIIPWAIAIVTVPNVLDVIRGAALRDLALVYAFGAGWGLGAVFFGQSIAMIGISLSFALCIGLATALGALIPMLREPAVFGTPGGLFTTAGIGLLVIAVAVCAMAGHRKEKQVQAQSGEEAGGGGRMMLGLVLGALGGIFSSMLNLAFNFSGGITQEAISAGARASAAADPVWAVTLLGGLTTNVIYCGCLLVRNKTWADYRKAGTGHYWLLAALMAAIWMPSIALYGRAAGMMGDLGGSAGWGVYMGMVIVISNVWGFVTGEWKGAQGSPVRIMIAGTGLLLLAIVLIGIGAAQSA